MYIYMRRIVYMNILVHVYMYRNIHLYIHCIYAWLWHDGKNCAYVTDYLWSISNVTVSFSLKYLLYFYSSFRFFFFYRFFAYDKHIPHWVQEARKKKKKKFTCIKKKWHLLEYILQKYNLCIIIIIFYYCFLLISSLWFLLKIKQKNCVGIYE